MSPGDEPSRAFEETRGRLLGSMRSRLGASLLGFVALAVTGLVLTAAAREERDALLERFSETWREAQAAGRLERCVADLHRQSTLLSQGYEGRAGEGLAAAVREDFEAATVRCEAAANVLRGGPGWQKELAEATELLKDLREVVAGLGVDHVAAVTRQALEVDPVAEALVSERFPAMRAELAERLERLQGEVAALGARGDQTLLIALVGPLVAFGLIAGLLMRRVLGSLRALQDAMYAFGAGNLRYRVNLGGQDEFTEVARQIHAMADRLGENQAELSNYAAELERSLASLKDAQETAVEQQKLAALGELVAGVAHEVNTPLGVAVTSASLVQDHVKELAAAAESGTATRGLLRRITADLGEVMRPLQDNLARAARLISSFKQVAVDRGSVSTRSARLDQWAQAVCHSLAPALRQHRVKVDLDLPALELRMAAGELEQILSNLILNACMHAYPEPSEGSDPRQVTVSAQVLSPEGGRPGLSLTVRDFGTGMDPETAARVFEPFFTTRRGRGGSGLGMHIVHQLVQERFEGRVSLETAPGKGTTWTLFLPLQTAALARDPGGSTADFVALRAPEVPMARENG